MNIEPVDADGLDLSPVLPQFRDIVRSMNRNAEPYVGKITWLVPRFGGKLVLVDRFELPELQETGMEAILTFFRNERGQQIMWVYLYARVSTEDQVTRGSSLEACTRAMLRKCAQRRLMVAAIILDAASGTLANRQGIDQLEAELQTGPVKIVITPTLERLDRNEENFSNRMPTWARWGALAYYGKHYEDARFDYMLWSDFDARSRGVHIVRVGEQVVEFGKRGAKNSLKDFLAKGGIGSFKGQDPFVLYDAVQEEFKSKPRSFARKRADCEETYLHIRIELMAAADARDWARFLRLITWLQQRTGKKVTTESLVWELRVGWVGGMNRTSPDWVGIPVPCQNLALETTVERHQDLLLALEQLLESKPGKRRRRFMIAMHDEDELDKLAHAELQEDRGDRIRLGFQCFNFDNHDQPVPARLSGTEDGDPTQQQLFCPTCSPQSSEGFRTRVPKISDHRLLLQLPRGLCEKCMRRSGLRHWRYEYYGAIRVALYRCEDCHIRPAAHGDAEPATGLPWSERLPDDPQAEREEPFVAVPKRPVETRPELPPGLGENGREGVNSVTFGHEESGMPTQANAEPTLTQPERDGRAPKKIPGITWHDAMPGRDIAHPPSALTVGAMAERMLHLLAQHGRQFHFRWSQMLEEAGGAAHPAIWKEPGYDARPLLSNLRRLAKSEGLPLMMFDYRHLRTRYVWLGPFQTGPNVKYLPKDSASPTVAPAPLTHARARHPRRYAQGWDGIQRPTIDARKAPLPARCPYPLYDGPMVEMPTFYADLSGPAGRERLLKFLIDIRGYCFLTEQLQIVCLGKRIPQGNEQARRCFNSATMDLDEALVVHRVLTDSERVEGSKQSVWWLVNLPPAGRDNA